MGYQIIHHTRVTFCRDASTSPWLARLPVAVLLYGPQQTPWLGCRRPCCESFSTSRHRCGLCTTIELDVIEPGIAAVVWTADTFWPLRWTTLTQRLCTSFTSLLLVSVRYAVVPYSRTLGVLLLPCCTGTGTRFVERGTCTWRCHTGYEALPQGVWYTPYPG